MSGITLEWYVYMVRCRDGNLYTGIATDIDRRFAEHQSGKGAKYLRGRSPLKLAFTAKIGKRSLALKIERLIKRLPKSEKEKIAAGGIGVSRLKRVLRFQTAVSPRDNAAIIMQKTEKQRGSKSEKEAAQMSDSALLLFL